MGDSPVIRTVIPSQMAEMPAIQRAIMDQVEAQGYPKEAVFAIRLALEEALANAIRHGNKSDPAKQVIVAYQVDAQRVWLQITDEGYGFDPNRVEDPTLEENLSRPHGRGVMLMRAYMTEVHFNERGNCVTMVKTRGCTLPHDSDDD